MDTTKDLRALLDAVPHDSAAATRTRRRQRVNGAFETVEDVRLTSETDFERFIVIVPAHFALGHIDRSSGLLNELKRLQNSRPSSSARSLTAFGAVTRFGDRSPLSTKP
jgi:hypothetical protein